MTAAAIGSQGAMCRMAAAASSFSTGMLFFSGKNLDRIHGAWFGANRYDRLDHRLPFTPGLRDFVTPAERTTAFGRPQNRWNGDKGC